MLAIKKKKKTLKRAACVGFLLTQSLKYIFFFTFLFWLKPRSASDPISSAVLPIWDSFYILLNLHVSQVSACFLLPFS